MSGDWDESSPRRGALAFYCQVVEMIIQGRFVDLD